MSISIRLKNFLDENHVSYSAMPHTTAYTAQGAAATMKISGKELAKTVVLQAGEETILAVLPAAHHASLEKLSSLLGKPVRLATEQEFSNLFPDCELGAMPPFGSLYDLPMYVDESLAEDEEIVFNAGRTTTRSACAMWILCGWRSQASARSRRRVERALIQAAGPDGLRRLEADARSTESRINPIFNSALSLSRGKRNTARE